MPAQSGPHLCGARSTDRGPLTSELLVRLNGSRAADWSPRGSLDPSSTVGRAYFFPHRSNLSRLARPPQVDHADDRRRGRRAQRFPRP